jgi:hypothetical protein
LTDGDQDVFDSIDNLNIFSILFWVFYGGFQLSAIEHPYNW